MGPLILFDGICNFCNSSVNFIIRHDTKKKFKFAPLQSEIGQQYLAAFSLDSKLDSLILIDEGRCYIESDAVLRISKHLDGLYKALYIFIYIPKSWRNFLYRSFARRRYQLFGKQEYCMFPTPEIKERFIHSEQD
ncbi:thiol-disulfide oxidoreductase DCC family protein [Ammoniphilus sp. YIM 78166]|uniref:thiol-disulfide oxidoreductase DCC family protein n=1 Tax=Ammoniphilus sp. YIM 78166 TaxID=1644106 RepID=UPI00107064E1|nr:DCC1-like thiol-disulfide oxidoreductase family protein [Ammoniphilus sp. YIM 78166]